MLIPDDFKETTVPFDYIRSKNFHKAKDIIKWKNNKQENIKNIYKKGLISLIKVYRSVFKRQSNKKKINV